MSEPCPHCGGTKTDPVPKTRKLVYFWARHLGYEVRQCGRCRHLRWMDPEGYRRPTPDSDPLTLEPVVHAQVSSARAGEASPIKSAARPSASYELQLQAQRAPGAAPVAAENSSEIVAQPAASPNAGLDEPTQPDSAPQSASMLRRGSCPNCGSTTYRRSHRRVLERLMLRPLMARCRECDRRFPLPRERRRIQSSAQA